MGYLFTSESVSEGHPDKVADQISDAVLDQYLARDPDSRVAIETLVTKNLVVLAGEVHTYDSVEKSIHREQIARQTIRQIGYTDPSLQFAADTVKVVDRVHKQSSDIRQGVNASDGKEQGAGDQGMMFGYACKEVDFDPSDESRVLMPMPLYYAHRLVEVLARVRKAGVRMQYLRPDSKSQVTVEYADDGRTPVSIPTVVISTCHHASASLSEIKRDIEQWVLPEVFRSRPDFLPKELIVNPAGPFIQGGPYADTGLTGRKIIVDTYGGRGAHGGGAFSGKDPSKVDRSAAYALRHVAKNVVAAGLADMVEIQVAYAIGCPKPVSVFVDSSGTVQHGLTDSNLRDMVQDESVFNLRPAEITRRLNLNQPIYQNTAAYGHFGRNCFSWEKLDAVSALRRAV